MDEIKEQVKGFKFLLDTKGGVSRNQPMTYKAKGKTVEQVLDEMFKKPELGYIIISKKGNAYDAKGERNRAVAEYKMAVNLGINYENALVVAKKFLATPFDPKTAQAAEMMSPGN